MGIPHSFISRITNAEVLERSQEITLSKMLLKHQLLFYGRIKRHPNHPAAVLMKDKIEQRRRGRPLLSWNAEIMRHISQIDLSAIDQVII